MHRIPLLLCACASAVAATPDPIELARKVGLGQCSKGAYAWRQHEITVQLDKNGKETHRESKTWDVIGLEGAQYRKLVVRDDKPLPPSEAEKQEQAMRAEADARRKAKRVGGARLFSARYSFALPYRKLAVI